MKTSNKSTEQKEYVINLAALEYIKADISEKSLTKISEKYGIRRQTLSKHLKDLGVTIINYQNIPRLNERVFDNMCTEEQFYWLGFLYADGNISSTGNRLEVRLSLNDLDHLEKFRTFLNLNTEIRTGINSQNYKFCHLSVRNKHIWESLNSLGCIPRKSLVLKFPELSLFGNKENILHFIRGYVDGDGCLSYYKKPNKKSYRTKLSIIGTESFLKSINMLFGNKGYLFKNSTNNTYELSFSDVSSRKLARYLYENATVYLQRKYNKYLEFCRIEEESSRRKSSKIGEGCDANTEVSSKITKGLETPQSVEGE